MSVSAAAFKKMSSSQRREERKRRYEEFSETETDSCYDTSDSEDDDQYKSAREVALILTELDGLCPTAEPVVSHMPEAAAASVSSSVSGKKRACFVCGGSSSVVHCAKMVLEEMEDEFHPTGDVFLNMATAILRYRSNMRTISSELGPIARAMRFKMMQHRLDCSTVLGRLVYSMLRDAVGTYRKMHVVTTKIAGVRLDFVRKELFISEVILPARYLNENCSRVNDMLVILGAFAQHKPECLRIPPIYSSARRKQ
jgi:hypothetical protein